MTAAFPPPSKDQKPWTARMLDATVFTKVGTGRRQGYDIGEVDAFRERAVGRVTDLERKLVVAETNWRKNHEALLAVKSEQAPDRHAWTGPHATAAVEAIVRGQAQAEVIDRHANREIGRRLDAADAMLVEAQKAAELVPPELVLPPEPTDTKFKAEWLRSSKKAIDEFLAALADYSAEVDRRRTEVEEHQERVANEERALGERRAAVLAEVDRIRADVEAIDLTGDGEATQAIEQVAS